MDNPVLLRQATVTVCHSRLSGQSKRAVCSRAKLATLVRHVTVAGPPWVPRIRSVALAGPGMFRLEFVMNVRPFAFGPLSGVTTSAPPLSAIVPVRQIQP